MAFQKNMGDVTVSASGVKEGILWSVQQFFQVEFEHETSANVNVSWDALVQWLIAQKPIDFTPNYTSPSTFYSCTLERTASDGKGLGWMWREMLPDKPFLWTTGLLVFRVEGTY